MSDVFEYTDAFGPDSTAIDRVAYNANTEDLFVKFTNGNERVYREVDAFTFTEFSEADSAGRFYNYEIMGEYTSVPVEDTQLVLVDPEGDVERLDAVVVGRRDGHDDASDPNSMKSIVDHWTELYGKNDSTFCAPEGGIFGGGTLTPPPAVVSTYAVVWQLEGTSLGGEWQYTATSEADAIEQFLHAVSQFVSPQNADKVKVKAVTHYFE